MFLFFQMSFCLASYVYERQLGPCFPNKNAILAHVVNHLDTNYTIATPCMEMWLQDPGQARKIIIDWISRLEPSIDEHIMSYISSVSRAWDYSLIDLVVYLADILTYEPDCVHDVTLLCTTMRSVFFEPVEEVESNFHTFHSVGELCRLQH